MVTLLEPWTNGQKQFAGLSTDEKPVNDVRNGDLFIEMDTGVWYLFDAEGGTWCATSSGSGGSGGGGGGTADEATVILLNNSTQYTYQVTIYTDPEDDTAHTKYTVPVQKGEILGKIETKVLLTNGVYPMYPYDLSGVNSDLTPIVTGYVSVESVQGGYRFDITGDCTILLTGKDPGSA